MWAKASEKYGPGVLRVVVEALEAPLRMLIDPSERVFWPFLLSAVVIAVVHALVTARGRVWAALQAGLTGKQLWLHPSALLDYQLLFAKSVVRALLFAPWLITSSLVAVKVLLAGFALFGAREPSGPPSFSLMAAYTVALFVASDLSRFLLHLLMHRVPVLWQLHQVHHSAEVLTPFTEYRTHPLEEVLQELRGAVTIGTVAGAFTWWQGGNVPSWEVLGVNALAFWLTALGSNLRHSHVWLSFGPLEGWLLSPAQHQLHHDADTGGLRVNYGSFLAIWDRLAGSLVRSREKRVTRFGLAAEELNHLPRSLGSVLLGPLVALVRPRKPVSARPEKPELG